MNISYLKDNETIKQKLEDDFLKLISSVQRKAFINTTQKRPQWQKNQAFKQKNPVC
jgi:hypothetical protein